MPPKKSPKSLKEKARAIQVAPKRKHRSTSPRDPKKGKNEPARSISLDGKKRRPSQDRASQTSPKSHRKRSKGSKSHSRSKSKSPIDDLSGNFSSAEEQRRKSSMDRAIQTSPRPKKRSRSPNDPKKSPQKEPSVSGSLGKDEKEPSVSGSLGKDEKEPSVSGSLGKDEKEPSVSGSLGKDEKEPSVSGSLEEDKKGQRKSSQDRASQTSPKRHRKRSKGSKSPSDNKSKSSKDNLSGNLSSAEEQQRRSSKDIAIQTSIFPKKRGRSPKNKTGSRASLDRKESSKDGAVDEQRNEDDKEGKRRLSQDRASQTSLKSRSDSKLSNVSRHSIKTDSFVSAGTGNEEKGKRKKRSSKDRAIQTSGISKHSNRSSKDKDDNLKEDASGKKRKSGESDAYSPAIAYLDRSMQTPGISVVSHSSSSAGSDSGSSSTHPRKDSPSIDLGKEDSWSDKDYEVPNFPDPVGMESEETLEVGGNDDYGGYGWNEYDETEYDDEDEDSDDDEDDESVGKRGSLDSNQDEDDKIISIPTWKKQGRTSKIPLVYMSQDELRQRGKRVKRKSRTLILIFTPIILVLNILLLIIFLFTEDDKDFYYYLTAAGWSHSELHVVPMFVVAVMASIVPAVVAISGAASRNQFLIVSFNVMGRVWFSVYAVNILAWIIFFGITLTNCHEKVITNAKTFYIGELSWDAESVALNFIMRKHHSCDPHRDLDWSRSTWYQRQVQINGKSSYRPFISMKDFFVTIGFGFVRPFPLFCCPTYDITEATLNMIRNKRLTPFHFETAGVRDCYTPEIASTTTPQQTNSTGATESGSTKTTLTNSSSMSTISKTDNLTTMSKGVNSTFSSTGSFKTSPIVTNTSTKERKFSHPRTSTQSSTIATTASTAISTASTTGAHTTSPILTSTNSSEINETTSEPTIATTTTTITKTTSANLTTSSEKSDTTKTSSPETNATTLTSSSGKKVTTTVRTKPTTGYTSKKATSPTASHTIIPPTRSSERSSPDVTTASKTSLPLTTAPIKTSTTDPLTRRSTTVPLSTTTAGPFFDPSSPYFEKAIKFSDHHNIEATFYFPTGNPQLNWPAALDYCHFKDEKLPLYLPMGLTTQELVFVSTFESLADHNQTHLGFKLIKKHGDKYFKSMLSNHFILREHSGIDSWDESSELMRFHGGYLYGCLNLEEELRSVCEDSKRLFICAKYYNVSIRVLPVPDIGTLFDDLMYFTDKEYIQAFFWSVKYSMRFDEAREFCATEYEGADLAVGFTEAELQFLAGFTYEIPESGRKIHLGFHRTSPNEQVFTSVKRGVPFSWPWAANDPSFNFGEKFLCLNLNYPAREDCRDEERPFVCAKYSKLPNRLDSGPAFQPLVELEHGSGLGSTCDVICTRILIFFLLTMTVMLCCIPFMIASLIAANIFLERRI